MKRLLLLIALVAVPLCAQVEFKTQTANGKPDVVSVTIDGKPFTDFYIGPETRKPYLHPLRAASGKVVTRTGEFEFTFGAGSATDALIGTVVYVNGVATVDVAGTTSNDIACGVIAAVPSATTVRVVIDGYVK